MDINELTFGQLKDLVEQFSPKRPISSGADALIGKYVIVRCKDAGVHAGILEHASGREALLSQSRRLWYWKSKKGSFLSGVARDGITNESKVGGAVRVYLSETCEIIETSEEAERTIRNAPVHERD